MALHGNHLAGRATYFGGSSDDSLETLAVAHDGTVVGFGATVSDDLPTLNAAQDVSGGSTDTFIVRFQPDLSELVFSTYLGGNGIDRAGPRGLAVDARGAVLITGGTDSRNFPTVRPIQSRYNGGAEDAFVATLAPNGDLAFSTFLGGGVGLFELGVAAVFDQIGGIHVAGVTSSVDFPTKRAQQAAYGGGFSDVFLLGLGTAGELSYATYLGGSGTDDIHGMAVDASGALRLVGMTTSSDFPAAQGHPGGGSDGFMAAIEPPRCHCRG